MSNNLIIELFIIGILILLNAVFVMAEFSLISSRKSKLETMLRNGDKSAVELLKNYVNPSNFLSTIQVAVTLISIIMGAYAGDGLAEHITPLLVSYPALSEYSHILSISLVIILVTFLTLVFGELVPKQIALANPELTAKLLIRPVLLIKRILFPFIWVLTFASNIIIKILKIRKLEHSRVTEDEIKAIIKEGKEEGEVQEIEHDLVERVFNLGDLKVESLMTHKGDIVWIDVNDDIDVVSSNIKNDIHTIFPVCDGDIDNIEGIIYIKDLFMCNISDKKIDVKEFIRKPLYIVESNSAYDLLELFKKEKVHFGVVINEFGTVSGIVTLNDILEALVGDISEESVADSNIVKRDDGSWLVDGNLPFFEFILEFDIQISDKTHLRFNTIAGFALHFIKHLPRTGEKFVHFGYEFEVVDMDDKRIDKLLVRKL